MPANHPYLSHIFLTEARTFAGRSSPNSNGNTTTRVNQACLKPFCDGLHAAPASMEVSSPLTHRTRSMGRFLAIDLKSVADPGFGVIGAAAGQQTFDQHGIIEFKQHNGVDRLLKL